MNYVVSNLKNNINIRNYLLSFHLSKVKTYNLLKDKLVYINNILAKENDKVKNGDIITINYNEKVNYKPFNYKIKILYEDDYLLIIDKPVGFMVHEDEINDYHTVANMVANYYLNNNIKHLVRYVHRLDTETSGILVFAKDMLTESYMNYHFKEHDFKRIYLALVSQTPNPDEGQIIAKIGADRHHNQRRRVSKTGQDAKTSYLVLKSFKNYSLVKLILDTGRTHQIRVHMRYLGYPLLGDELYGGSKRYIKRVALHSATFLFVHPFTNKEIKIECPLPDDMAKLIK